MSPSPSLRFICHACVLLEDDGGDLLMDPWLFGDVFNDSWSLRAPPDLDALDVSRVRYVWISHTHPDHFHIPSLQWIRNRVSEPLTAFTRRSGNQTLRKTMSKLGFEVVELDPEEEHRVNDALSITMFAHHDDSSLVIQHNDRVVLNQNDCSLDDEQIARLKDAFPRIDAWFYQFSIGGYCGNAADPAGIRQERSRFLERIGQYFTQLQPQTFVPFASFVSYVKAGNAHLNDHVITVDDLVTTFPRLPIQVLWSGDELLWEGWEERSRTNQDQWRNVFNQPLDPAKPHRTVEESTLLDAGLRLVRQASDATGPEATAIIVVETGRAAVLDFPHRRFEIVDDPDPASVACRMPAEELLHFCSSPYGADVYYGGCFHVVDSGLWRSLLWFRSTLEPGETSRLSQLVARADRWPEPIRRLLRPPGRRLRRWWKRRDSQVKAAAPRTHDLDHSARGVHTCESTSVSSSTTRSDPVKGKAPS